MEGAQLAQAGARELMNFDQALEELTRWQRRAGELEAEVKSLQTEIANIATKAGEAIAALVAVHDKHPRPELCPACKVLGRVP